MKRLLLRLACVALPALLALGCGDRSTVRDGKQLLRIGHFPNVTHAHGLVAHALSRAGKGWFEERLGPDVKVEWYTYNAGPSAMEALLNGSLDATYVGPSPAINAHVRSKGAEVRVLAGATRGGAALVVHGDGGIRTPADFKGRTVGTPQLGNTQDVACRAWLVAQGFRVTQTGGDVTVLDTDNPNQLPLFQKRELDAVWTVEPWVSRLELDGGGKVFLEEKDTLTTVLASSAALLRDRPALARKLVDAHRELTAWIVAHPDEARVLVAAELLSETHREISKALLDRAWPRLRFDDRVAGSDFEAFVQAAQAVGYLKGGGDVSRLVASPP